MACISERETSLCGGDDDAVSTSRTPTIIGNNFYQVH